MRTPGLRTPGQLELLHNLKFYEPASGMVKKKESRKEGE